MSANTYTYLYYRHLKLHSLLYTSIPKFEELSASERQLYHNDKELYTKSARKNGKSIYFAKSGTDGETWVPLIEKAYAKLHGNYASLSGGEACEGIEDLTGLVLSLILHCASPHCLSVAPIQRCIQLYPYNGQLLKTVKISLTFLSVLQDILDTDVFWSQELLLANQDRLFGCGFDNLDSSRSGDQSATVNGLIGAHAYSVLRAVEYNGKRFVVVRNPWGDSEWTGPWADGSKQWTQEWLPALEALKHSFGDDGEFVMECRFSLKIDHFTPSQRLPVTDKEFLENWHVIDRTLLFDSSWAMSSQWLKVTARPLPSPWAYGDVSCLSCLFHPVSPHSQSFKTPFPFLPQLEPSWCSQNLTKDTSNKYLARTAGSSTLSFSERARSGLSPSPHTPGSIPVV